VRSVVPAGGVRRAAGSVELQRGLRGGAAVGRQRHLSSLSLSRSLSPSLSLSLVLIRSLSFCLYASRLFSLSVTCWQGGWEQAFGCGLSCHTDRAT
jgi:hypothetical protein